MAPPPDPGVRSRIAAWRVLRRVHADDAWSVQAVDTALRRSGLGQRDRAFAANLAYSTLRWEGTLDWALATAVTRPLEDVEPPALDVLRLGAWQLLFGAVPDRAVVDTAVEVTRSEVGAHVTGFVNGVLRGLARGKDRLPWPPDDDPRGIALRTGYPAWIVEEAQAVFADRARAVLEAGNEPPGVVVRATGDRDALLAELRAEGVDATEGRWSPSAVTAPGADPGSLAAVAEGRAVVQDEASMLVALAAASGAPPHWRALDVCAAPGGKTTHLAQLGATVASADVRPARARMVAETAGSTPAGDRIGVVAADGTRPPWRSASFDVVLLDAPCTGLGVVRRRPELRWRRVPADARELAGLQGRLLEASAPLVAPGGVLLYSACTWTRVETTGVVEAFLALNGDRFEVDDTAAALAGIGVPGAGRPPGDTGPGLLLDPAADGTDGMYLCRLRRVLSA